MTDSEPPVLRSAANPTVRHLIRLRDNRARRRADRVIVDGWRETAQAIKGGLRLCSIYLDEDADLANLGSASNPDAQFVLSATSHPSQRQLVSDPVMKKISYGQSSRGIVAEFEQPERALTSLDLSASPLILILDQIEKPGNVGAVFRCADAAAVDAVILCGGCSDVFNPNAIRSSLGAVFRVASADATESEIQEFLLEHKIRALAARVESSQSVWASDLSTPLAVILGSEAQGLGDRWQKLGDLQIPGVRIPMSGEVDSLNLSVSAALISFEAARRRVPSTTETDH